jgi:virginiamycin A acetyltransferase
VSFVFPIHAAPHEIGAHSGVSGAKIYYWNSPARLTVGRYSQIAHEASFVLGGEHPKHSLSISTAIARIGPHSRCKGNITIGNDVWVGHRATVLSGVTIGNGAIIGAGALISKDVPPYAVVIGNPQTILRMRFPRATIAALQTLNWWDYEPDQINPIVHASSSVENFIERFRAWLGAHS